jgi:hypothetical protein
VIADQIVRFVFVVVVLALPVLAAWAIGSGIARRREAAQRPRIRRRAITIGAALSALLAMAWLSGLFVDPRQEQYDTFFTALTQGCLHECTEGEAACEAYCHCYRDAFQAQVTPEEVAAISRRLSQAQSRQAVQAVLDDFRPAMTAADARCRDELARP